MDKMVLGKGKEIEEKKKNQIFSSVLIAMAFLNEYLPDLWGDRFDGFAEELFEFHSPIFSIARLLSAAMIVTIPIALTYQRKTFNRFVVYFGLPSFAANCVFFNEYMYCYQNPRCCQFTELSRGFATNSYFRCIFFIFFELLKLISVLIVLKRNKAELKFSSPGDFSCFLVFSVPLLFVNMPITFPSQFTGVFLTEYVIGSMNTLDIIWAVSIILLIAVLTLLFRKRSVEDRRILLIVLSLSLLFQYNLFMQGADFTMISRLPLQLCNIACFILPIAVLSNKRPLLCFASIANVMGAIAAVFVCDTPGDSGLFYSLNVHYILEHTGIIVIGMLLVTLGIITPIDKKDLLNVFKIYNIYFFSVLIIGTVFNGINAANDFAPVVYSLNPYVEIDYHCNYLFMFLDDPVASIIPALAGMYSIYIPIGSYARLQLSELVVYFVFLIVCLAPYFVIRLLQKCSNKNEYYS